MLSIKDTGPGIPPDELPKVLETFGQGSLTKKTAEGGTGLGLPIVRRLIELHGGRFELSSSPDVGTEAVAFFPENRVLCEDTPTPQNQAANLDIPQPLPQLEQEAQKNHSTA